MIDGMFEDTKAGDNPPDILPEPEEGKEDKSDEQKPPKPLTPRRGDSV